MRPEINQLGKKTWKYKIMEIQNYSIGEIREREKISKYSSKYATVLNFFEEGLVFPSVTS